MAGEIELASWQSYVGVTYELQATQDFQSWLPVQTFQGTGGKISYVAQPTGPKKFFRVKQTFKNGLEPADLQAIVAFDGSYIKLEWSLYLYPLAGTFKILKDNLQIAAVPFMSYENVYVHSQPGPGPHTYSVTFWS